jgi:SOS-response transcriptional repressor LexA
MQGEYNVYVSSCQQKSYVYESFNIGQIEPLYSSEEIGQRLRDWGVEKYGSVDAFAKALEMPPNSLSRYFGGSVRLGADTLEKLAHLECDTNWLLTGRSKKDRDRNSADHAGAMKAMPVLGYFDADPDAPAQWEPTPGMFFPFLPGNYFGIVIRGDSMIHAELPNRRPGLSPDDLVIFERIRRPKNGDVVAVLLPDGERLVKVFLRKGPQVSLLSANRFRNYPGIELTEDVVLEWGVYLTHFPLDPALKRRIGLKD